MANIIYKLSPKENHGRCEILARFYDSNRFDMRGHTGIFINPSCWDVKDKSIRVSSRMNTPENMKARSARKKLEDLEKFIFDAFDEAGQSLPSRWFQNTIDSFNGINKKGEDRMLLADVIEMYIADSGMAASTARQYQVLKRHLLKFGETEYVLYADDFDNDKCDDFEEFLHEDSGCERAQNTINSKMRRLRAAVNYGIKKGFCKSIEINIAADHYGTPIFLRLEERDALYAAELPPALAVQRDIFIFQCHVGCRVSDLYSLTLDNVTEDGFLQYIQFKVRKINAKTIRVPLSDTAKDLIIKYIDNGTGKLFPFIAEQNYNYAIKDMCRLAGLDRMVAIQDGNYETQFVPIWQIASSHMARKTFSGNMFKKTKSEAITRSMTGHSKNSRELLRYTDVDDEMKQDAVGLIE